MAKGGVESQLSDVYFVSTGLKKKDLRENAIGSEVSERTSNQAHSYFLKLTLNESTGV